MRSAGPPRLLPVTIDAGKVELRRFVDEHVAAVVAAMEQSLPELAVWFPWAQVPPDEAAQRARARDARRAFDAGTDFEFSLFEIGSDELVGGCRVNPLAGVGMAEIGYWVRSDRHRRGYATATVRAATTAVFEHLDNIGEVQVRMDVNNTASAGVAAAAGFTLVGEITRPAVAPGHSGRAFVWSTQRPA